MVAIDAQRSFFEGSPDPHGARLQESLLIDRLVDLLVQKATTRVYWPEVYSHTVRLLKNAPLSTGQRLRVFRRIHNAEAYAEAGEFGAAAFELRLLRTQLAQPRRPPSAPNRNVPPSRHAAPPTPASIGSRRPLPPKSHARLERTSDLHDLDRSRILQMALASVSLAASLD